MKKLSIIIISLLLFTSACMDSSSQQVIEQQHTEKYIELIDKQKHPSSTNIIDTLPLEPLQKGDDGLPVDRLQQVLIQIGYPIERTGLFDTETVWAITDIQLQFEDMMVTGMYDKKMKKRLERIYLEEESVNIGSSLKIASDDSIEAANRIHNPYEILVLVNKQYALPNDYIPHDLVIPNVRFPFVEDLPKKQMRQIAADALEEMFAAADEVGLGLFAQSGYRSYQTQESLYSNYVLVHGEQQANTFSAKPGESEHQTGLAMDVTSPEVNYQLTTDFGETDEGIWLKENAADYGFIIRYPEGKEDITGYQYEPWHLRYVGEKAATFIAERDITLEEYIEIIMLGQL